MISKMSGIVTAVIAGNLDLNKPEDQAAVAMSIAQEIGSLSKHEFLEIQAESLHVVKEIKEIGAQIIEAPVRLPDGHWGVEGIGDDALMVITLVSHVLVFNLTGFFDADRLKDSKESFSGLMPSTTPILTPTPLPQS